VGAQGKGGAGCKAPLINRRQFYSPVFASGRCLPALPPGEARQPERALSHLDANALAVHFDSSVAILQITMARILAYLALVAVASGVLTRKDRGLPTSEKDFKIVFENTGVEKGLGIFWGGNSISEGIAMDQGKRRL
jgi:hypothetical protein